MPSMFEPSYDVLPLLHQSFDLTLTSPRKTVKKEYLLKLYQDLIQSFSQKCQSHLVIDLVNNMKQ